jgi:cobalt/nickel transport system permease protein
MHMSDALISPAVGGSFWVLSAGLIGWCGRRLRAFGDDRTLPMMGVMAAFVFAAQMINFTIPLTGSSGHLGGGLLLAIVLGPYAAFLAITSVLVVQALFFMDGGLLALGCNIFNLGVAPCCIAWPLIYKPLAAGQRTGARAYAAALLAAIVSLQIGALGVVLQTTGSGISALPFGRFLLLMLPVHLAIGVVEGFVTAAVIAFVFQARPQALYEVAAGGRPAGQSLKSVYAGLLAAAAITGMAVSWFASRHPDGLEWSIARVSGQEELETPAGGVHETLARIQEQTAFLPDYAIPVTAERAAEAVSETADAAAWPNVDIGTSLSGLAGGAMTLALAGLIAYGARKRETS